MPWHNLSEFIPWILAIFFVLFLIACCSWLYRCIQKCDDQCPGILPTRSPYNPNSPMTPFPNIRHTRNCESTRPLTSRSATNESNEPSSSIVSSSSIVHYHGPKAPPYAPFADRPPPPSYEEACGSGTANTSHQSTSSATNIDTENTNETNNTDAVTASIPDTGNAASIPDTGNAASIPVTANDSNINDVVNESVAIDTPHDEPLINDEDDDEELNDVVIETTAVNAATAESTEIGEVYL